MYGRSDESYYQIYLGIKNLLFPSLSNQYKIINNNHNRIQDYQKVLSKNIISTTINGDIVNYPKPDNIDYEIKNKILSHEMNTRNNNYIYSRFVYTLLYKTRKNRL